ncbi:diguanylate cyclase (plasmid) [Pseudomonas cannabina pv. alisalensis]|uniref:diguanylate cyclase n=1 Tax=Pseudomonas syringae pv. maculicola str. ES4326 TaxID=629265 RepID=A0A8T8CAT4_PSEYM|nr:MULTISPECIES: diguanylate cyclase [Pseudomonas syringae group]QHF00427.1 diguanylate cyclase [Pseudomonas syringae pv. maculicola str. ES4326]UBZ00403.1 diguanylate cyclase [Pseudomonas cannabina pv. alisalensis]
MNHETINRVLQSAWRSQVLTRPSEYTLEVFKAVFARVRSNTIDSLSGDFETELGLLSSLISSNQSLTARLLEGIDLQMDKLQAASRRESDARASDQGPSAIYIPGFGERSAFFASGLNSMGLKILSLDLDASLDLVADLRERMPTSGLVLVGGGVVSHPEACHALEALAAHHDSDLLVVIAEDTPMTFEERLVAATFGVVRLLGVEADVKTLRTLIRSRARDSQINGYKVLLLDDSKTDAYPAIKFMREEGIEVLHILSPAGVLKAIEEFRPDVVVTDFHMPGANGDQVASVIRQDSDAVMPIIFLSSERNTETQLIALSKGADAFVQKPLKRGAFIKALKALISRSKAFDSRMRRDPLTGLLNHGQLMASASRVSASGSVPNTMVMIDIDHFKQVNDTFGHPVGDKVLVGLAEILSDNLRSTDFIGRMGGEEFAVLMVGAPISDARNVIDRIRELFSNLQFETGLQDQGDSGKWFACTFSAGVALLDGSAAISMKAADHALYKAKHGGRNRVEAAD